ncbi:hypothetical protein PAMP_015852 [Pampus punctatissimus]
MRGGGTQAVLNIFHKEEKEVEEEEEEEKRNAGGRVSWLAGIRSLSGGTNHAMTVNITSQLRDDKDLYNSSGELQ